MIGLAIGATFVSGLAQGIAGMGSAARANQQAINQWMQGEFEKGINNGKEIFRAAYAEGQQAKVNRQTNLAAYEYEYSAKNRVNADNIFTNSIIARSQAVAMAATANTLAHRKIGGGTANALQRQNMINSLSQINQLSKNKDRAFENIENQVQNYRNQIQSNVFMPNIIGSTPQPVLSSTSAPLVVGALGGLAAGLTFGAMAGSTPAPSASPSGPIAQTASSTGNYFGGTNTVMGGTSTSFGGITGSSSMFGGATGGGLMFGNY